MSKFLELQAKHAELKKKFWEANTLQTNAMGEVDRLHNVKHDLYAEMDKVLKEVGDMPDEEKPDDYYLSNP